MTKPVSLVADIQDVVLLRSVLDGNLEEFQAHQIDRIHSRGKHEVGRKAGRLSRPADRNLAVFGGLSLWQVHDDLPGHWFADRSNETKSGLILTT